MKTWEHIKKGVPIRIEIGELFRRIPALLLEFRPIPNWSSKPQQHNKVASVSLSANAVYEY